MFSFYDSVEFNKTDDGYEVKSSAYIKARYLLFIPKFMPQRKSF